MTKKRPFGETQLALLAGVLFADCLSASLNDESVEDALAERGCTGDELAEAALDHGIRTLATCCPFAAECAASSSSAAAAASASETPLAQSKAPL